MIQEFLRSVSLFAQLDDDELAQVLMVGVVRRHAEGAVIITEGSPGGQLHVLYRGKVRISRFISATSSFPSTARSCRVSPRNSRFVTPKRCRRGSRWPS